MRAFNVKQANTTANEVASDWLRKWYDFSRPITKRITAELLSRISWNGFNNVVRERNILYVFMFEFISDYSYSNSFSIHVFIRKKEIESSWQPKPLYELCLAVGAFKCSSTFNWSTDNNQAKTWSLLTDAILALAEKKSKHKLVTVKSFQAFKLLTVANLRYHLSCDTKLPCYTLPPTQYHSFFRNLRPLRANILMFQYFGRNW